jgi:hypothetical protein
MADDQDNQKPGQPSQPSQAEKFEPAVFRGRKSAAGRDMVALAKLGGMATQRIARAGGKIGRTPKPTPCPRCGETCESATMSRKHCRKPRRKL